MNFQGIPVVKGGGNRVRHSANKSRYSTIFDTMIGPGRTLPLIHAGLRVTALFRISRSSPLSRNRNNSSNEMIESPPLRCKFEDEQLNDVLTSKAFPSGFHKRAHVQVIRPYCREIRFGKHLGIPLQTNCKHAWIPFCPKNSNNGSSAFSRFSPICLHVCAPHDPGCVPRPSRTDNLC